MPQAQANGPLNCPLAVRSSRSGTWRSYWPMGFFDWESGSSLFGCRENPGRGGPLYQVVVRIKQGQKLWPNCANYRKSGRAIGIRWHATGRHNTARSTPARDESNATSPRPPHCPADEEPYFGKHAELAKKGKIVCGNYLSPTPRIEFGGYPGQNNC